MEEKTGKVIFVREFDARKDRVGAENVERRCEVGPNGKLSLFTDLLGDPICRVRHSPAFLMLVAEIGEEIVGIIRGCIKTVTCGKKLSRNVKNINNNNIEFGDVNVAVKHLPIYTKAAYILGLRVSPTHRRMGIGLKLVRTMEDWFRQNGAEYSYIATENDNQPSIKLFTDKCGYSKFRTPSILVHPVFAHRISVSNRVSIFQLAPRDAETLYRSRFATTEFFPRDIDSVLKNKLSLGTFLAVPCADDNFDKWQGSGKFLSNPPESWAVLSIWNCNDVFKLEVRGASRVKRMLATATRIIDKAVPFLGLPSIPEVFKPFGLHFLYGLGGEGPQAVQLMSTLCAYAHNLAKARGCGVVATEVASHDPLKIGIPHWKMLSCDEDLWCIKRLGEDYSDGSVGDWTKSPAGVSIFVDPREV